MQLVFSGNILEKLSNAKFDENPSGGSQFFFHVEGLTVRGTEGRTTNGRADGRREMTHPKSLLII
jgi:hypothetical protein